MSRYVSNGASSAAAASGTVLFNIIGQSSVHVKVRRIRIGFEGATTPSQARFGLYRSTARGTESTTAAPIAEDSAAPASVTTVDTAWSGAATLASTAIDTRSCDVLAETEFLLELPDELDTGTGTANGIAVKLLDNALPTGVNAVWSLVEDE